MLLKEPSVRRTEMGSCARRGQLPYLHEAVARCHLRVTLRRDTNLPLYEGFKNIKLSAAAAGMQATCLLQALWAAMWPKAEA